MYFPKPAINENDLAIIERGDTASHSIEAGQYVSWKGKLGKANSAILQGATLDDSLFDYETDGVINELSNNFTDAIKFEKVADEGQTYTPTSTGLYVYGNILNLSKTNNITILYLEAGHQYGIVQASLGLREDPAPSMTKSLYKICYRLSNS